MTPITAQVDVFIPRPPEAVFEYFADLRHEPEYNPEVRDIRKTTEGPLARGTRFEGQHDGLGPVSWESSMRPATWPSRARWARGPTAGSATSTPPVKASER